jgi:predicted RNA-binding Zn-ribbon protein involved in translation (DUF1610 family)
MKRHKPMSEWITFECPACGYIEDIEEGYFVPGHEHICPDCGEAMECIDE